MDGCIFCKIIKKEIPADTVYEDEKFLGFMDIQPMALGHMLIIPKEHIVWMQDSSDELIADIFKLTKKLMIAVKKGVGCDYVQVSIVGKDVPHFHIHLIPRYLNDGLASWTPRGYDEEAKMMKTKITEAL